MNLPTLDAKWAGDLRRNPHKKMLNFGDMEKSFVPKTG